MCPHGSGALSHVRQIDDDDSSCMTAFSTQSLLQKPRSHTRSLNMVETGSGIVSQSLFDFALSVDTHVQRPREWVLKCLAVFAGNQLVEKHDLIGVKDGDYETGIEQYNLLPVQRSWLRRCITKAEGCMVSALAERSVEQPAHSESSAIKGLVDAIKAEEVRSPQKRSGRDQCISLWTGQ